MAAKTPLVAAFMAMAIAVPGFALAAAPDAGEATRQLPGALSDLIKAAYTCQGVLGTDMLDQAKGLAHDELIKLGLDDFNTALLVTSAEGAARQTCSDTATCWRSLPGLDASSSERDGTNACNAELSAQIEKIQTLNGAVGL